MKYIKHTALVIGGVMVGAFTGYILGYQTTTPLTGYENVFGLHTVKIGNKVADMTVTNVGPMKADYGEFAKDNLRVKFTGRATIAGTFYLIDSFTTAYCFTDLDVQSWTRIPVLNTDMVNTDFCFIDFEHAKKSFEGKESGRATVIIDNYTRNRFPSEVFNTAELVKVVKMH